MIGFINFIRDITDTEKDVYNRKQKSLILITTMLQRNAESDENARNS